MQQLAQSTQNAIITILSTYFNFNEDSLQALIKATSNIGGVSFISVKNYCSDKSNNTANVDYLFNIGASYENMVKKDIDRVKEFDLDTLDVSNIWWASLNLPKLGLTKTQYRDKVKEEAAQAKKELIESFEKPRTKTDTMIRFNPMLQFCTTTARLGLFGQAISTKVNVQGEIKVTAKAPKTYAKELIRKQAGCSSEKLKRLVLDNVLATIKISGETIEINC